MNKDVVYIEPEDDITDVLAKLKKSEAKIVALVPPKKIGALRSMVNIKLIAKTAKDTEKIAVLVTTDESVKRMAASVRVPVAKNLQSRPEIPELDESEAEDKGEQVIEEDLAPDTDDPAKPEKPEKNEKNPEDAANKTKKSAQSDTEKKPKVPDIKKYQKYIIAGAVFGVALIIFLVWAFVFAPAATVTVAVKTSASNFSESVTLTLSNMAAEPESGVFLVEQLKSETTESVEFVATGEEDHGNKATGKLKLVYEASYGENLTYTIPKGQVFTQSGLNFTADEAVTITVPVCEAMNTGGRCSASASVAITAVEPGTKYNLSVGGTWSSPASGTIIVSDTNGTAGGSSNLVTVVTQSDIDTATKKLNSATDASTDGEAELRAQIGDSDLALEDTYNVSAGELVATPAVGEVVEDGVVPKLSAVTTYSILVADRTEVENYLGAKTSLGNGQRIYSFGSPYFERITATNDTTYTARLKATIYLGPEITEEQVLEQIKGQRLGDARSLLRSIEGVSDVTIDTSFFWVSSIPDDANKVTVNLIDADNTGSDANAAEAETE